MEEKNFENKVKRYLTQQGCYFVKFFGCAYTKSGVPDLLVCCNGYFIGVELKATKGKVSALQEYNIEQIKSAGGQAFVLRPQDFDDFKVLIQKLKGGAT